MTATKLMVNRLNGFNGYFENEDGNILGVVRNLTKQENVNIFSIDDISIVPVEHVEVSFEEGYEVNGVIVDVVETTTVFDIISNPLRSSLIDEFTKTPEDIRAQLGKLGFKCSTLMSKKNEDKKDNGRFSKKSKYKPRDSISRCTIKKLKRNGVWTPGVLRSNRNGHLNLPAVLIT